MRLAPLSFSRGDNAKQVRDDPHRSVKNLTSNRSQFMTNRGQGGGGGGDDSPIAYQMTRLYQTSSLVPLTKAQSCRDLLAKDF